VAAAQERNGASPLTALDAFSCRVTARNQPTPGFFEGMLLGGDLGVCITVRPDS
jgi:hypothetical protein